MCATDGGKAAPPDRGLALTVGELRLSNRARTALRSENIRTVRDILQAEQDRGLLQIRNVGKSLRREIIEALREVGYNLDGTVYSETAYPLVTEPDANAVPSGTGAPAAEVVAKERALPKTVVFVDYEHWFISLRELHQRRPNIETWFTDLKARGKLMEITFFGDFTDSGGMSEEINSIRVYTNRIIETKNPSEYLKKDYTDFIMLDNIYQKIIASPEIEQVVLFTGDGHFAGVVSYLRNFCSKRVGVYGVDRGISSQLETISDWCVRIPFINEPYMECRRAILKNLKYAEDHTKSPTFNSTVRLAAEYYNLPDDAVEAELRLLINEGVVYSVSERSRWDYKVMLNILKVNWNMIEDEKLRDEIFN